MQRTRVESSVSNLTTILPEVSYNDRERHCPYGRFHRIDNYRSFTGTGRAIESLASRGAYGNILLRTTGNRLT